MPARATAVCTAVADPTLPFGNINSNAPGPSTANLNITVTCTTAALSLLATTGVRVCVGVGSRRWWRQQFHLPHDDHHQQ